MGSFVASTKNQLIEYLLSNHHTTPIVLLSGIGGTLYEWKEMMTSELTVLAYNRAGYGKSKSVTREGTVKEASLELYALLSPLGSAVLGVLLIDSTSINVERIERVHLCTEL